MNDFDKRLATEIVYLWNDYDEMFVRNDPSGLVFGKQPGGREVVLPAESDTAIRALPGKVEITTQSVFV
ncbi:MAG: hypothetical protein ABI863_09865 [Ginsengibacter sp.]